MESSGSSAQPVDPPGPRWSQILGTAIALFTLAIPTVLIAYYSTADALNAAPSPSSLQHYPLIVDHGD